MRGSEVCETKSDGSKVFTFKSEDGSYTRQSKVVAPGGLETTIFPFGYDGSDKYNSVKQIIVRGTKDLPVGMLKAATSGYGFTKASSPILRSLETEMSELHTVVLSREGETKKISKKTIQFKISEFERTTRRLDADLKSKTKDTQTFSKNLLSELIPSVFTKSLLSYSAGDIHSFLLNRDTKGATFSADDIGVIAKLISESKVDFASVGHHSIELAGKTIDRILVQELISKFKKLLDRKSKSQKLEDEWQEFLEKYVLFLRLGYIEKVAKPNLPGWKSKYPDFLMIDMQHYVDVMEIKTHLTQVLQYDDSRDNFYWAPEVSKALSQVNNYIDIINNERHSLTKLLSDEYGLDVQAEAVRPRVLILVGCSDFMAGPGTLAFGKAKRQKLQHDFRRLRTSSANIEIMLFDELLAGLENVLKVLGREDK